MQTLIVIRMIVSNMKQTVFSLFFYFTRFVHNNISVRVVIIQACFSFLYICDDINWAVRGCSVISLKFPLTRLEEKEDELKCFFLNVIRS